MKIKNIILYTTLIGSMSLSSCADFLNEDINPNELSPSVFWKSEQDILKGLTSVYAALQPNMNWAIPYERYIVIDNYRSDEIKYRDDVTSWMDIASFNNDQNNSVTKGEWTNLYKGINYANQCIDNIPNVPETNDDIKKLKTQAIAEARFLRAYFYYRLYLNFGEKIPIYKTQIKGEDSEFYPEQAKEGELVQFIETELSEIQPSLPEKYDTEEDKGRATRYAAAAILGKFYMFRHELTKAEAEFKKIIDQENTLFKLTENWNDNFDGLHKNNSESIFEVQFTGNTTGDHSEYNYITLHLATDVIGGYEEAYPSDWIYEVLSNDKTSTGEYSVRTLNTIMIDDPGCKPWYYETGKSYSDYHKGGKKYWKKFVTWEEGMSPYWDMSFFNIPIVRYADVLLLYAECLNDRGATDDNGKGAIDYINDVRRRAGVPELEAPMGKDEILKHLQDVERPCELALEGSRWYDLVRWGITEQTLKDHNKQLVENYVDTKHKLFPIPHQEFLLNPDWEQNPNFGK